MAGEICCKTYVHSVTKSFPSLGISFLQPPPQSDFSSSSNEQDTSKHLKDIHMSGCLMEDFLNSASDNTNKNLETCGVLGAFFKDKTFYVTTLIIPKQEATSNSAVNEEDIFAIQNEGSSFPVGWIHVMVPEAVGIVKAPTDKSRKCGIFRLSADGMSILRECQEKDRTG